MYTSYELWRGQIDPGATTDSKWLIIGSLPSTCLRIQGYIYMYIMRESWKDNILPAPVCYARRDQIHDSSSRFQRPPRYTNARKRVAKIGGGENVGHKNVPVRNGERTRSQTSSRACLHEGCFPSGQETVYRGCASSSPPVYAGRRFLRRE